MAILQFRENPGFTIGNGAEISRRDREIIHGLMVKAMPGTIFPGKIGGPAFLVLEFHGGGKPFLAALHGEYVRRHFSRPK